MPETEIKNEIPVENSRAYANFYSWFLLPLMIVLVGLGLAIPLFNTLYGESEDISYWMNEIKYGSYNKRWTSAQRMASIMMADTNQIPHDSGFQGKLIGALEEARIDDYKMRFFLISIMGMTRDKAYGKTLVNSLEDNNRDCVRAAINSIGLIKYKPGFSAIIDMLKYEDDNRIRLDLCVTLGELGNKEAISILSNIHSNDENQNVRWEAALALLKLGYENSKSTIASLLSMEEYSKYPQITNDEIERTILTILEIIDRLGLNNDIAFTPSIVALASSNKYPLVKSRAKNILEANG